MRHWTLRSKIITFIVLISVYPMILMSIISAYNYDKIIKERFINYAQSNMDRISSYLNSDVDEMKESLLHMLQDPTFYDLVLKQPNTPIASLEMITLRRDIRSYLSSIVFSKKDFDIGGIYFYDNVQLITYAQQAGLAGSDVDLPFESMRDSFGASRQAQFFFYPSGGQTYTYIIQQILHKDTFKPIGLVYYRIDPDYLEGFIKNTYSDSDEAILLYTYDGRRIAKQGDEDIEDIIELGQLYEEKPGVDTIEDGRNTYYYVTESISALNVTLITIVSGDSLTQDSRKVVNLVLLLYLANIPILLLIAYFLYQNIIKPMGVLITKMNQFEEGQFDTTIDMSREDEFGYMYSAFNKMTTNINTLVSDVYIKELAKKDAEIAALQEQINPHFLYNTLESINWRAQLAGEEEIALMIQALSKIMDVSINRDHKKFVTLDKEIEYAKHYMYIMQMRYDDTLDYYMDIQDIPESFEVPKLIIQPLLENAIKHGIEPVGEGCVTLKVRQVEAGGPFMEMRVEDNGEGLSDSQLQQLREILALEKKNIHLQKGKRVSIGLQNVARRLYLIYGQKADVYIESKRGQGTRVILWIPIQQDEQKGDGDGTL